MPLGFWKQKEYHLISYPNIIVLILGRVHVDLAGCLQTCCVAENELLTLLSPSHMCWDYKCVLVFVCWDKISVCVLGWSETLGSLLHSSKA